MLIKCQRCHQNAFVFSFESKKVCRKCSALIAGRRPKQDEYKYQGNKLDHHKRRVGLATTRLTGVSKGRHKLRRSQSALTTSDISEGIFETQMAIETPTVVDDTATYAPPNVLRMQCMTLFIPFDAGNNFYRNNAKQGTFQADFVPQRDNFFAPSSNPTASQALSSFNTKPYPGHQVFEAKSTPLDEEEILAGYKTSCSSTSWRARTRWSGSDCMPPVPSTCTCS